MKSLLENSVCQERTSSCQGQRGRENIQPEPDVSDRHGKKPYPNAISAVSKAFVSNGFDVFIPEWLLFLGKSFIPTPPEALESSERRTSRTRRSLLTGQLPGSHSCSWGHSATRHQSWLASQHRGQAPSLKGDGVAISTLPSRCPEHTASEAPSGKFSSNPLPCLQRRL